MTRTDLLLISRKDLARVHLAHRHRPTRTLCGAEIADAETVTGVRRAEICKVCWERAKEESDGVL